MSELQQTRHTQDDSRLPCHYPGCVESFPRGQDWRRHMGEVHEPPKRCSAPGCRYEVKRTYRMRNHLKKTHGFTHEAAVAEALNISSASKRAVASIIRANRAPPHIAFDAGSTGSFGPSTRPQVNPLGFPTHPAQSTIPSSVDPLCHRNNTQYNAEAPPLYTELLYGESGVEGGLIDWEMNVSDSETDEQRTH